MQIKAKKCPNCGGTDFYTLGEETPHAALVSAVLDNNGSFTLEDSKVLGVTPNICNECEYVMLFRTFNP